MSLREELVASIEAVTDADKSTTDSAAYDLAYSRSFDFLRNHGQALLDALRDVERMDWVDKRAHCLDWVEGEPIRRAIQADTGDEFYSDESWRNAIDKAMATPSLCVVCDEPNEYDRRSGVCARCQGIIEPDNTARSKTVDGGGALEGINKHRGNPENPPST